MHDQPATNNNNQQPTNSSSNSTGPFLSFVIRGLKKEINAIRY
jgi:hypothetical protein